MASGVRVISAWVATAFSVALASLVFLVLSSAVVQGPLTLHSPVGVLAQATAGLLALAAAATSMVLARVEFAWHLDGLVCTAVLAGLAGTVLAGWEHASDPVRSAGSVVAPLLLPSLLALVERRTLGTVRWSLVAAGAVGALSFVRFLVRDPFRDPECWVDCSLQDVAPLPSGDATWLVEALLLVAAAAVAVSALLLTLRLAARRRSGGEQIRWLDLASAVSATVAAATGGAAAFPADRGTVARLVAVALLAQCVTAVLVAAQPALAIRRRRELRRLAIALGEQPPLGTLESTLGRLLGDKDLRVAYWLPESKAYVDSGGREILPDSRTAVTLQRDGAPLARVYLDLPDRDAAELEDLVGSAARLAIDSERLQAEVRAQLAELVDARQRIVAAADDARRQVERTIHDEVQSELLGALFEIGHTRSQAERSAAEPTARETTYLADEVRALVSDLREFARGVYPAVLDGSGLPAALAALADEAPVALRIDCRVNGTASSEAERATYLLVHDATARAVEDLDIVVAVDDGWMTVTIGGHPGAVRDDLADRVGAMGGSVAVERDVLRAVLPCG